MLLTATNTYAGNTVISAGTLALGVNGITNGTIASTNIIIANGATLDVSARANQTLTLAAYQTLSNTTSTATLNGNFNASIGTNSLVYSSGTPSFTIKNGALTVASTSVINVNNTGAALTAGSYKIVSAGAGGSVAGTVPSSVNTTGLAAGATASLQITSGELYLVVTAGTPPTPRINGISLSGTTLSINATNGAASGSWTLLQSTNVALPLSQWATNLTGTFDGSGNLSTNIANTVSNLQEFYILKQ
jgi:autotransporter-associated beta strand protein